MNWSHHFFPFDNESIFYRSWTSPVPSRTALVLLHGRYTHSEYWEQLLDPGKPFHLFAFDYPGQGRSSGRRGACDVFNVLPRLLGAFLDQVVHPRCDRVVLVGESLGALLAFYGIVHCQHEVDGTIFVPGVFDIPALRKEYSRLKLRLFDAILPHYRTTNRRPFSYYTEDPGLLRTMEEDSLFCRRCSVRYIRGIVRFLDYLHVHAHLLSVPLLVLHGGKDHYSSVDSARAFLDKINPSTCWDLQVLPNSKHWLAGSGDRGIISDRLYRWLESCPNSKPRDTT